MDEKLIILKYLINELMQGLENNAKRKAVEEQETKANKDKAYYDKKWTYYNMPQVSKAKLKRLRLSINELLREME